MKISVIIPSYCRPDDLNRCLESLCNQIRLPDETIVVIRANDLLTSEYLASGDLIKLPLKIVRADKPGQIHALNLGKSNATGDIIAITDDDGAPRPDWLQRIEKHFSDDERVGGVGGRDWVHSENKILDESQQIVGIVTWFGKRIGGHHWGVGLPREVEILKGANMSYRSSAVQSIHFDERLLGKGAQVHNDLAFSLRAKKAGWKLIYDPVVAIDHYIAPRESHEDRVVFNHEAHFNAVYNETLVILEYLLMPRRLVFCAWSIVVGTRVCPGLFQFMMSAIKRDDTALRRFKSTLSGRYRGFAAYREYNK